MKFFMKWIGATLAIAALIVALLGSMVAVTLAFIWSLTLYGVWGGLAALVVGGSLLCGFLFALLESFSD